MNEELRKQIHNNLNEKETDDLLEIWETNDRVEWSDLAFEVLQDILTERIGSLPPQNGPILERKTDEGDDDLEEWETKLLDDENQPDFYDPVEVLSLRDNINKVAKVAVFVYIALSILNFPAFQNILFGMKISASNMPEIIWGFLVTVLGTAIEIALAYFPLKAMGHILRILMEMEFNSRKVKSQ